jgi:hypothetical protein
MANHISNTLTEGSLLCRKLILSGYLNSAPNTNIFLFCRFVELVIYQMRRKTPSSKFLQGEEDVNLR